MADSTRFLVRSFGFRAEAFLSAQQFLDSGLVEETKCLILILDLRMPGIDGLELQRNLASANKRIPIIFISARVDRPGADRSHRRRCRGFPVQTVQRRCIVQRNPSSVDSTEFRIANSTSFLVSGREKISICFCNLLSSALNVKEPGDPSLVFVVHAHNVRATAMARIASCSVRLHRAVLVPTFHGVAPGDYSAASRILRSLPTE